MLFAVFGCCVIVVLFLVGLGFAYVCSFTLVCVAFGLLGGVAGACERVVCLADWFLCWLVVWQLCFCWCLVVCSFRFALLGC